METIKSFKRSGYCTQFNISDIGKEVILMGWVNKSRNLGSLIFADLRDRTGILLILFRHEFILAFFEKATFL